MSLHRMRQSILSRKGATSVEYMIGIILIVFIVMGIIKLFGPIITGKFEDSGNTVSKIDSEKGYQVAVKKNNQIVVDGRPEDDNVVDEKGKQGGGGTKQKKSIKHDDKTQTVEMLPAAKKKEKAGFNPIILIIFLGLGGLLFFVMYKGNRKEG